VVIVLCLIISLIGLLFLSTFGLLASGLLSANCVDNDVCRARENLWPRGRVHHPGAGEAGCGERPGRGDLLPERTRRGRWAYALGYEKAPWISR
jgi:hypothetical protein